MTFRETFYQVKGLMESRLHDFGLESADASTMGWTTMLSIEQNTRVTIDVPLNITYSDAFLITGTLETSTYSRLNNKTVKLKVGDKVVSTTTTNVNGEYSFTQTPVSTDTYSFQVIFEGTNFYTASESSIITRTPGKDTSIINLDTQSTKHYGDNVTLSGVLLTDDGEYIKNASVKYYIDNSLVDTLTTSKYGIFIAPATSISGFDSLNVQFVYEGDNNYTSVSANQTIDVYQLDLRLTSDKEILSYVDEDTATITAQLIDDAPTPKNLAIADTEIVFEHPIFTTYSDISSIPKQYDSFELLFKTSGAELSIDNDSFYYTINISSNDSSQFKLIWDKPNLYLYQDGNEILSNDIINTNNQAINPSLDDYVHFIVNDVDNELFSDIRLEKVSSNSVYTGTNGQAQYVYASQGIGDVTISANVSGSTLVSKTYSIEDCNYFNSAEVTRSTTNGSTIYDNNMSVALPTNCEISYDMWSTSPINTAEHRYFLMSKSKYSNDTTQPNEALFFDHYHSSSGGIGQFGKRENNSTINLIQNLSLPIETTHRIKYVKTGTNIDMYLDDELKGSATITWIDNYSDYILSMMRWSTTGTSKLSNVKIKALPNISVSLTGNEKILSYYDGDECILSATVLDENGEGISGELVNFYAGNTLLSSSNTDNNGIATYTYASAGTGDVEFTASVGDIVSEIYVVEDIWLFDDLTNQTIVETHWNIPSNVKNSTYNFSEDGWTMGNVSSYTRMSNTFTLPDLPYLVSFQINQLTTVGLTYEILTQSLYFSSGSDGKIGVVSRPISWVLGHTYTLRIYSDKVELYDEDTLVQTYPTSIVGNTIAQWGTGANRILTIKDFKIKVL